MRHDDDGVAVVLALGLVSVLLTVGLVATGVASLFVAQRRVQAAADLGALAGAASVGNGCGEASRIVTANRGELEHCTAEGSGVLAVVVSRALPAVLGGGTVRAQARAGPVGVLPRSPP